MSRSELRRYTVALGSTVVKASRTRLQGQLFAPSAHPCYSSLVPSNTCAKVGLTHFFVAAVLAGTEGTAYEIGVHGGYYPARFRAQSRS